MGKLELTAAGDDNVIHTPITSRQRELLVAIQQAPGSTVSELQREIGASSGSFQFLSFRLLERGLVRQEQDVSGRTRWFPAEFEIALRELLTPIQQVLLRLLDNGENWWQQDLATAAQSHPSTISRHLAQLEELKLVERWKDHRRGMVRCCDPLP